jgi:hypothetical protein
MTTNTRTINTILDKLEKSTALTKDGRDWLIAAADPFHDTEYVVKGYPDVCTAPTIVQSSKDSCNCQFPQLARAW